MLNHKLVSFFLALSTIFLFSFESIAQSEKEIFWWTDQFFRESVKQSEQNKYREVCIISCEANLITGDIKPISTSNPEIVWEELFEALKQSKIRQAFYILDYIEKNNINPINTKTVSESFYDLGDWITSNRKCTNEEYIDAFISYKIAMSLNSNPKRATSLFQLGDTCLESNNLIYTSGDGGLKGFILSYGYGLNLQPSSKSYITFASRLYTIFTYNSEYLNDIDVFDQTIISALEKALEFPDETISLGFPQYWSILPEYFSSEIIASSHALAYIYIGNTRRKSGDLKSSTQALKRAIELEPNLAFTYNSLGKVQVLQNRLEEATKSFEEAIRKKPDYAESFKNLGIIFKKTEQFQKALSAYRKAVELSPNNTIYKANLAEAEANLAYINQINPKLNQSIRRSVVRVKTSSLIKDNCADGTGWVVSNSNNQAWIITNRHVVEVCNDNVEVVLFDNPSESLPAEVYKIDEEKDLAILKVSKIPADIEPLPIASTSPTDSDTIFVIGHPAQGGGDSWTTVKGEISAIILGNELLQLDITVDGGNSGSPVFNKNNEVVGLIFELSNDKRLESFATGSFGFAYPINVIQEKLKLWGVPYENK